TEEELEGVYKKYKDFYIQYYQDNPAATTNCYKEFLMAQGKQDVKLPYTPRQGGLGGTMYMGTEGDRIGTYEGIDLNNPEICLCEQTIQKLAEKIQDAGVLLVVIRISLLWMGTPSDTWTFEEEFQRLMGITWKKFHEECDHIRTILIVDEVQ
ncbi:3422_t:CDS:2, partial [Paraglomus occultum]